MKVIDSGLHQSIVQDQFSALREIQSWKTKKEMSWEEIADHLGFPMEVLWKLNPKLKEFNKLRPQTNVKYPGILKAISYTEDGLRYACNKHGKLLYYENAVLSMFNEDGTRRIVPRVKGSLKLAKNSYVDKFVPFNHYVIGSKQTRLRPKHQIAEFLWINKAISMMYNSSPRARVVRMNTPAKAA